MGVPTHPASAASTSDDATLLDVGDTASQQPRPWPSWATRRLCGVAFILMLVSTGIWATGTRQAGIVIWASPPLSPAPPPPLPPTEAAEATLAAEVAQAAQTAQDAQSEGGRACVMESGGPYRKKSVQVNSCGHDAYCCAGGAQAGKSNCIGAKSAEHTAAALGLTAASIRACCHTGGYTPNAPAHVTVAAEGLQEAHQPCDWLDSNHWSYDTR